MNEYLVVRFNPHLSPTAEKKRVQALDIATAVYSSGWPLHEIISARLMVFGVEEGV